MFNTNREEQGRRDGVISVVQYFGTCLVSRGMVDGTVT